MTYKKLWLSLVSADQEKLKEELIKIRELFSTNTRKIANKRLREKDFFNPPKNDNEYFYYVCCRNILYYYIPEFAKNMYCENVYGNELITFELLIERGVI